MKVVYSPSHRSSRVSLRNVRTAGAVELSAVHRTRSLNFFPSSDSDLDSAARTLASVLAAVVVLVSGANPSVASTVTEVLSNPQGNYYDRENVEALATELDASKKDFIKLRAEETELITKLIQKDDLLEKTTTALKDAGGPVVVQQVPAKLTTELTPAELKSVCAEELEESRAQLRKVQVRRLNDLGRTDDLY